jgi:hypothetical protein
MIDLTDRLEHETRTIVVLETDTTSALDHWQRRGWRHDAVTNNTDGTCTIHLRRPRTA